MWLQQMKNTISIRWIKLSGHKRKKNWMQTRKGCSMVELEGNSVMQKGYLESFTLTSRKGVPKAGLVTRLQNWDGRTWYVWQDACYVISSNPKRNCVLMVQNNVSNLAGYSWKLLMVGSSEFAQAWGE
ncbi:hypothetical protein E3N88_35806 [Mikania micrantha]|uniref:Uncharacterized protein n=1 Tax=Mikania micrantha TaxID=192012 RepID=A0A5N6M2V9_9ASTR|nr:hypothetical protein E3N88_35806 [Mikania micrantha]